MATQLRPRNYPPRPLLSKYSTAFRSPPSGAGRSFHGAVGAVRIDVERTRGSLDYFAGYHDLFDAFQAGKIEVERPRAEMIFSSPEKAPPQMNRMFVVSTCRNSCCGCLRPPCGGTDATVPSMIFSKACCTPSPETSRVIEGLSDLRLILSISSM